MKKSIGWLLFLVISISFFGCAKKAPVHQKWAGEIEYNRIVIEDNEFRVNGKRIWINGANTPWNRWNDFGGAYNDDWWDDHLDWIRENGINATRVWINCNNDNGAIIIDKDGMITGVSDKHWEDLDLFFESAARRKVYIMATLLSFDHFKTPNNNQHREQAEYWRNMVKNKEAAESFVTHYTIPFVQRYRDNPYLWSIDLCNEPDWIHENRECGMIGWDHLSYFFAINAAAIHEHSNILVTVGMAFPKYNVDGTGYSGNKISDAFLQKLYPNPNAFVDFWSPHYYDWVGGHYGIPFNLKPYGNRPVGWGFHNSKPALIGETKAKGSSGKTILEDYTGAFENGWQGVMAWTSNGVDDNGDLYDLAPATKYMMENYFELIFPLD